MNIKFFSIKKTHLHLYDPSEEDKKLSVIAAAAAAAAAAATAKSLQSCPTLCDPIDVESS